MRLRNVRGAREAMIDSKYTVNEPEQYKGRWNEFFGNNNPIRLEIGTGKGKFLMTLATQNPVEKSHGAAPDSSQYRA